MATLLITYDLNKETKRPPIVRAVKKVSKTWARLSESSYAVRTNKSPYTVFDELKKHIDNNDQLYIINLAKPYAGFGSTKVNDWLDSNLPG